MDWLKQTEQSKQPSAGESDAQNSTGQKVKESGANTAANIPRRRMSVAGSGLFYVNHHVVENATDFLEKVPRTKNNSFESSTSASSGNVAVPNDDDGPEMVLAEAETRTRRKEIPALLPLSSVMKSNADEQTPAVSHIIREKPNEFNDFCPFRRLPNVPFAINGRPRMRSKSVDCFPSMPPPLETLFETEEEYDEENGKQDPPIAPINAESEALFKQSELTLNIVRKWTDKVMQ